MKLFSQKTGTALARQKWVIMSVIGAPLVVLVLHALSIHLADEGMYWWDEPMHALGGAAIACSVFFAMRFARRRGMLPALPLWFEGVCSVGMVMTAGVVWEWYEWFLWVYYDPALNLTLDDALKDLAYDVFGGILFFVGRVLATSEGED